MDWFQKGLLILLLITLGYNLHAVWLYRNPEKWPKDMFHIAYLPKWFKSDRSFKIQAAVGVVVLSFVFLLILFYFLASFG